jgi:lysophospholipase L1-like esterase
MREIIDRFNQTIATLPNEPAFPNVRVLDLRGTLSPEPADYASWWDNELHPSPKGFEEVAAKFAAALASLP